MQLPASPMTLADCPVRTTLDVMTGKWKPLILFFLKPGKQRYGALRAHLPEAPERVFIQQLRQLEQDGIVDRFVYHEVPPRVEYCVSGYGETLMAILQQMADWGQRHRAQADAAKSSSLVSRMASNPSNVSTAEADR